MAVCVCWCGCLFRSRWYMRDGQGYKQHSTWLVPVFGWFVVVRRARTAWSPFLPSVLVRGLISFCSCSCSCSCIWHLCKNSKDAKTFQRKVACPGSLSMSLSTNHLTDRLADHDGVHGGVWAWLDIVRID